MQYMQVEAVDLY